jgi:hypothetical protein
MKKPNPVKKAIYRVFIHDNYSEIQRNTNQGATRRARSSRGEALSPP